MGTNSCDRMVGQHDVIRALVDKARAADENNRTEQRFPFFQPVSILAEPDGTTSLSAFSRDISEVGIGLLLYFPVRLRFVYLKIDLGDGEEVAVSGRVRWCHPCGQGWYAAGVTFDDCESDEIGYDAGVPLG